MGRRSWALLSATLFILSAASPRTAIACGPPCRVSAPECTQQGVSCVKTPTSLWVWQGDPGDGWKPNVATGHCGTYACGSIRCACGPPLAPIYCTPFSGKLDSAGKSSQAACLAVNASRGPQAVTEGTSKAEETKK